MPIYNFYVSEFVFDGKLKFVVSKDNKFENWAKLIKVAFFKYLDCHEFDASIILHRFW